MKVDLSTARHAAVASSKPDGRTRWTELHVWYVPGYRRPWIAQTLGCSILPAETTIERRSSSATLERALRLFSDSDLGIIASDGAREFAEEEGLPVMGNQGWPGNSRVALEMLFGDGGAGLADAAERVLGIPAAAMDNPRDVRVPLRAIFPFIDRAAFQRALPKGGA